MSDFESQDPCCSEERHADSKFQFKASPNKLHFQSNISIPQGFPKEEHLLPCYWPSVLASVRNYCKAGLGTTSFRVLNSLIRPSFWISAWMFGVGARSIRSTRLELCRRLCCFRGSSSPKSRSCFDLTGRREDHSTTSCSQPLPN